MYLLTEWRSRTYVHGPHTGQASCFRSYFVFFTEVLYLFRDDYVFRSVGEINEIIFEAMLLKRQDASEFIKDAEFINGLQSHEVLLQRHKPLHEAKVGLRIITLTSLKLDAH